MTIAVNSSKMVNISFCKNGLTAAYGVTILINMEKREEVDSFKNRDRASQ